MKNLFLYFISFSFLYTLDSCHTMKPMTEGSTITNKMLYQYKWYLSDLNGTPYTFAGRGSGGTDDYTWIQFSDGKPPKVSGSTGCNRMMGTADISNASSMKFSPLATTKMACPGKTETTLLNALATVDNYSVSDAQLLLNNGTTLVAKLNGVSIETDKLSGTWVLNYISGPRIAFEGLYPDKKPSISFNFSAKELMGHTTCNGFSAKYTMNGNNIHFDDALKTMMFCEGGSEETFLNMLKKINRYSLNENALTFLIGDVAVMRFTKK